MANFPLGRGKAMSEPELHDFLDTTTRVPQDRDQRCGRLPARQPGLVRVA